MGSVLAHLFDTLPFTCALADMDREERVSLRRMPPAALRRYIKYCHQDDGVFQQYPGTKGYRSDDPGAADPGAPPVTAEFAYAWGWQNHGTRVTQVDCRARGNGQSLQRVLESVEFGRHEAGREILPEIRVTTPRGVLVLPLRPEFLHSKWKVFQGNLPESSSWLWPLQARLDSAVVAAYAYDLVDGAVSPYVRSHKDEGDLALETYDSATDPQWTARALGGGFMGGATTDSHPGGGTGAAGVNEDPAVFVVGPPRILVVLSFSVFKARADVEPGGLLRMTKVHPHIMVRSSVALTKVEAAVRGRRPAQMTVLDKGDPHSESPCCSAGAKMGSLFVNDNNLVNADTIFNFPILTYWSAVFSYIEVDPAKRLDGQMLKMVDRRKPDRPTIAHAGTRVVPNAWVPGQHVELACKKVRRQGEFDNIHMAPRLTLHGVAEVLWFQQLDYLPTKIPVTAANRDSFHLDDIAMAPICEHDCFHFHWRWLRGSTSHWTKGWSAAGPHTEPGATMVPLNQDVEVAIDGPNGWIYRATATPDDGQAVIPPLHWQVFMHHGAGYSQDFVPHAVSTDGLVNFTTSIGGRVLFRGADGKVIDGAKNSAVLYWNFRWYIDMVDGAPAVLPRLDVPNIDRLRAY